MPARAPTRPRNAWPFRPTPILSRVGFFRCGFRIPQPSDAVVLAAVGARSARVRLSSPTLATYTREPGPAARKGRVFFDLQSWGTRGMNVVMNNTAQRDERNFAELDRDEAVARIASEVLNLDTIATRHSDRLDFSDQAVWTLRAALEAAYEAGLAASAKKK